MGQTILITTLVLLPIMVAMLTVLRWLSDALWPLPLWDMIISIEIKECTAATEYLISSPTYRGQLLWFLLKI